MGNFAKAWVGFTLGDWCERIDVRDFIQKNYTPYEGDESFLAAPTARTRRLMAKLDAKGTRPAVDIPAAAETMLASAIPKSK